MQRLRSQALDAFESADFGAAITFLDKILEVSFPGGAAARPGADCFALKGTFIDFDTLCITRNQDRDRIRWVFGLLALE